MRGVAFVIAALALAGCSQTASEDVYLVVPDDAVMTTGKYGGTYGAKAGVGGIAGGTDHVASRAAGCPEDADVLHGGTLYCTGH